MPTLINPQINGNMPRFGITEKKRAEIDALAIAVLDAQHDVEVYQAIVTSLALKQNDFQALLATADNNRTLALNNVNLKNQLLQSALDLSKNSEIVFNDMAQANAKSKELAQSIKVLMDKLIYAVEIINRLSNLVIMKKALNPLISDELVSMIGNAGNDANNAVAVTLIALKSTFVAQATNMEAFAAITLEKIQATDLNESLNVEGKSNSTIIMPDKHGKLTPQLAPPISKMIDEAYKQAKENYDFMHKATTAVSTQLNEASVKLNEAQIRLKSLQSGLAAANAAAQAA